MLTDISQLMVLWVSELFFGQSRQISLERPQLVYDLLLQVDLALEGREQAHIGRDEIINIGTESRGKVPVNRTTEICGHGDKITTQNATT